MSGWKKRGLLPVCAAGIVFAAALTALIALAGALALYRGWLPMERAGLCACAAVFAAVFVSVRLCVRIRGRQPLPTAGVTAGGYILAVAVVCAAVRGGGWEGWLTRTVVSALAGALCGAFMSIRPRRSSRRRTHGRN